MAQYKVPQDVEADDKLIGPFSFRQFVYLLIAAGLIATAVGLFQLFPLLAIIPIPFALFLLALALPLKKDQPMETYLAAIVSYYLKPRTRIWMPGQKESPILITAPKIVEDVRKRDISSEEATHRLSFLADIVDTGGYAIKGAGSSPMREELVAEANATPDMFETYHSQVLNRVVDQDKMSRHDTAVMEMKNAIRRANTPMDAMATVSGERTISRTERKADTPEEVMPPIQLTTFRDKIPKIGDGLTAEALLKPDEEIENSSVVIRPEAEFGKDKKVATVRVPGAEQPTVEDNTPEPQPISAENSTTNPVNNSIMELAHNSDFSVATIAKEANRINRKENGDEIFVSLH